MKEQLERDIEVLRKIEWLLNEELSQDTFYEYNFMEEREQFFFTKSDLESRLNKLNTKEPEVTIWDVIEECKGVTGKGEMTAILDKYEMKYARQYDWRPLSKNVHILDQPLNFTAKGHQLRLKEQK